MNVETAITTRYTCKAFKQDAMIPEATFTRVLALTQRAPTCMNSQPYIAVVVSSDKEKELLGGSMLETNQQRVLDAPKTVVFCADLEPVRLVDQMGDLSARIGHEKQASVAKAKLPLAVVGSHNWFVKCITTLLKSLIFPLVSWWIKPVMTGIVGESVRTWSIKQTMLPASTFLLAATSAGIATAPMEGFDAQRVRRALGLPPRYLPALVISCGYPKEELKREKRTHRFAAEGVFFHGNYNTPYLGIEPIVAGPSEMEMEGKGE